MTETQEVITG